MDVLELGGVRLAYRIDGRPGAPLVVFCNSLGTDHRSWDLQVEALASSFRILRFDTRGHGQSGVPAGPYTTADMAGDLSALLDALKVSGPAALIGLSLGGMVAMDFAARWPERLSSLILCATAASMAGAGALWDRRIDAARKGGMASFVDETLGRWFTDGFAERHPKRYRAIRRQIESTPVEGYISAVAAVRDVELTDVVQTIHVPTFLVAADEDPATPAAGMKKLSEAIPGKRMFRVIGPARHMLNVEQPGQFNEFLREAL